MTKSQVAAIKQAQAIIASRFSSVEVAEFGKQITQVEVKDITYFISLTIQVELTNLSEGNLLRALDREYWSIHIGRNGGMTCVMCPRSMEQFHGKRAFGMKFDVKH